MSDPEYRYGPGSVIHDVQDSIISVSISEDSRKMSGEGLPYIWRVLGEVGFDPLDDFSGCYSVKRRKVVIYLFVPENRPGGVRGQGVSSVPRC